jgi:hypothetical protein
MVTLISLTRLTPHLHDIHKYSTKLPDDNYSGQHLSHLYTSAGLTAFGVGDVVSSAKVQHLRPEQFVGGWSTLPGKFNYKQQGSLQVTPLRLPLVAPREIP